MTPEIAATLQQVRKGSAFEWSILGQLAFVLYAYASALRRGDLNAVVLGLGFWAVEFVWEMGNALLLHVSQQAPLWAVAGKSVYVIYIGLNLEIALMFAVLPLVLLLLLPRDRRLRLLGVPNRILIPTALGAFCVAVELVLNRLGVLLWSWPFWRWPHIWLILLAYCGPCVTLAWLYDRVSLRRKVKGMLVAIAMAAGCHLVLASLLGWV